MDICGIEIDIRGDRQDFSFHPHLNPLSHILPDEHSGQAHDRLCLGVGTAEEMMASYIKANGLTCVQPLESHIQACRELKYSDYLRDEYWNIFSRWFIWLRGEKCQVCACTKWLNVHHNNYDHQGVEYLYLNDVVVLCYRCHGLFHKYGKHRNDRW